MSGVANTAQTFAIPVLLTRRGVDAAADVTTSVAIRAVCIDAAHWSQGRSTATVDAVQAICAIAMRLASAFSASAEYTSSFTCTITIENTFRLELNAATRFGLAQIGAEAVAVIGAWLRASISHTEPPTEAVDVTNTPVGLDA